MYLHLLIRTHPVFIISKEKFNQTFHQLQPQTQIHITNESSSYASMVIVHPLSLMSLYWVQTVCELVLKN